MEIVDGNIVRVMESWPLQLVVDTPSGRLGVLLTEETKIMERGRSSGPNALLPGENLSVDIGSIDAPATRIVGFANWQDYDAATFIIANFSLNEVNQVVMPPVPAGKVALMGPLPIVNTLPSPFIDVVNLDDITHNVTLETAFRPDGSFTSYAQLIDPGNRAIFGPQFIVGFGAMLDSNVTLRMRTTLPISTVSPLARVCHRETDNP